jgi:hypothetical protein
LLKTCGWRIPKRRDPSPPLQATSSPRTADFSWSSPTEQAGMQINVVLNWLDELKRQVPVT